ncbi:hypothetical protein AA0473_1436 [Acetobacter orleanensis NRIC 0473]|uniref:Uncharacterized protein n=1 Tax=Acetobacter orleanensis TaxID=104099 RepID=A0A4Y3TK08_9PROT|nr:hypothetical protein Abol_014_036 [Acetobacter orleanensis JCM 7639]GBR27440.1 hypothetical protein AA0473_1436 [Acetobacter orleanensis NRIC 0473]GEB82093.1 hypothetical protein AOR01nite_05700 [Acetobacter orleanensis]
MRRVARHRTREETAQIDKTQSIDITRDKPENEYPPGGNRNREKDSRHYSDSSGNKR